MILECESEIVSSNVSWYYGEKRSVIQNSDRFSIHTAVLNNMSLVTRLTIFNFTRQDAGGFLTRVLWEELNSVPREAAHRIGVGGELYTR